MSKETAPTHEQNPDERFDFERLPLKIQTAIEKKAQEIIEIHADEFTPKSVARFFLLPEKSIEERHCQYFKAYAVHAARSLIVGAYYGPNFDIRHFSEDEQVATISKDSSSLIFKGSLFFHDVAHTVLALARHPDKESPSALIPHFQRFTEYGHHTTSDVERKQILDTNYLDERIAFHWTGNSNQPFFETPEKIIKKINMARHAATKEGQVDIQKAEKYFLALHTRDCLLPEARYGQINPFDVNSADIKKIDRVDVSNINEASRGILLRIFREFETNPRVLLDIFMDTTMPFMKYHEPKIARLFK